MSGLEPGQVKIGRATPVAGTPQLIVNRPREHFVVAEGQRPRQEPIEGHRSLLGGEVLRLQVGDRVPEVVRAGPGLGAGVRLGAGAAAL